MKMNEIQFYNCLPKLVDCSQEEQYGVGPKMDCPKFWISKNVQFRHMCGAFCVVQNLGQSMLGHYTILLLPATLD